MGSLLLAFDWQLPLVILEVAFALGMVIFVHELGHFMVAKWCGVQCDKFYIGFDFFGLRLWRRKWGETEYGIGIFPLGGYVKMLGQDDNPAEMAKEMEKARAKAEAEGGPDAKPKYDPRSYPAQTVPERMAIISAGVIMNLIFAVIFASVAYGLGVKYQTCEIFSVSPGGVAWDFGLRSGDEIVTLNGIKNPSFKDLQIAVALAGEDPIEMEVRRFETGAIEHMSIVMPPRKSQQLIRSLGVLPPHEPVIGGKKGEDLKLPETPFGESKPDVKPGDQIVAVAGQPVEGYGDLNAYFVQHPDETFTMTLERTSASGAAARHDVPVPPNPMKTFGLRMEWGGISNVQRESPAAKAGLQEGDVITAVDGQPASEIDPFTFAEQLRRRGEEKGASVSLTIKRGDAPNTIVVPLREVTWYNAIRDSNSDMPLSAIGVTYVISNRIAGPLRADASEELRTLAGKEIEEAWVIRPTDDEEEKAEDEKVAFTIKEKYPDHFASFFAIVQHSPTGSTVRLKLKDIEKPVELKTTNLEGYYQPTRGIPLQLDTEIRQAESFGEAVALGFKETKDGALQIYLFLQKLFDGSVSARSLGGPITIAKHAGYSAYEGLSELLIFITMLSANLAVINFLPIPVLDGGHMVFLIYEAVFRRPPSVKVMETLNILGFCLVMTLMVWVFGLDLGFISRQG